MAEELIVTFNKLPELGVALHGILAEHVKAIAAAIRRDAYDLAPVQTGFLRSALYVVTHDASTYGQGGIDPPPGAYLLPEVARPADDQTAIVAAGANYSIYQELGSRRNLAQPYLGPAVEGLAIRFNSGGDIEAKLAKVVGS